jgi:hypothetical protein
VLATGLIKRYNILARASGKGFKLVFYPGDGFYQDYANFYLKTQKRTEKLLAPSPSNSHPLQLVAYFHELLGHSHKEFTDKERAQAAELLKVYSEEEVRALIEHAVREGKKTSTPIQFFGFVLGFEEPWKAGRKRAACAICKGQGFLSVSGEHGELVARICSHGQSVGSSDTRN